MRHVLADNSCATDGGSRDLTVSDCEKALLAVGTHLIPKPSRRTRVVLGGGKQAQTETWPSCGRKSPISEIRNWFSHPRLLWTSSPTQSGCFLPRRCTRRARTTGQMFLRSSPIILSLGGQSPTSAPQYVRNLIRCLRAIIIRVYPDMQLNLHEHGPCRRTGRVSGHQSYASALYSQGYDQVRAKITRNHAVRDPTSHIREIRTALQLPS